MKQEIGYRTFAKINLYLDVLHRRRDGYHNLETIFQTVTLSDELYFREEASGISLECTLPELESGEENLAYQAARLLQDRTGCSKGVHIQITKRIPIAAGLAGGSGNAAATLVALNLLWGLGLTRGKLHILARELGADVPYCLIGGTMAGTQRGDDLTPLPPLENAWFVLLHPSLAVSTKRVFGDPNLARRRERLIAGRTRRFRKALRVLREEGISAVLYNRMEKYVFADYPHLAEAKRELLDAGCAAAVMSGSGPTLLGVCASRDEAERVSEKLKGHKTSVVTAAPNGLEPLS